MKLTFISWNIALFATAGVILRRLHRPEAIRAVTGAPMRVAFGLHPARFSRQAVGKGTDVYPCRLPIGH